MRLLLKIVTLASLLAFAFMAWQFWSGMTPGERYHVVDKARSGDLGGLLGTLRFKAGEEVGRQRDQAGAAASRALQDASGRLIDGAARSLQRQTEAAVEQGRARLDDALGSDDDFSAPASTRR